MQPYMALFLRTSHNRTAFYSLELTMPSNAAPNLTSRILCPSIAARITGKPSPLSTPVAGAARWPQFHANKPMFAPTVLLNDAPVKDFLPL